MKSPSPLSNINPDALENFVNNGGLNTLDKEEGRDSVKIQPPLVTEPTQITGEPERAEGFAFKDPVELLFFLDDDISSGRVVLHPWQVQFMLDFASKAHSKDTPFQACVQAANGSGKDKYIVAPCLVWLCMAFLQARGVATNGSGVQLDNQTEVYIRWLCEKANSKIGPKIWKCNYRYYECTATGSPIVLFATDEPNKAEGYHPIVAGAKMAIFTSESKAIPDSIFEALERCSGFTHRVDVSTPGLPLGYFYDTCISGLERKNVNDIKILASTQVLLYKITAHDCSHITQAEIDRLESKLPGGKNNPVFKSSVLAEFGTTDEMVVIPYTYIWRAVNTPVEGGWIKESHNKGGLDLSDGGDETVLTVRNGNKVLAVIPFKFDNTEDTIAFLNEKFKEWDLKHPDALVFADCGGLGKPMIDRLKRQGWVNMRYLDNRNKAYEPRTYTNRGSETWFHLRKLLERHEIILPSDKTLIKQLSSRYYKITQKNTHQLLSKLESRSRGYPSPDRADSLVLAFCDYKSTFREDKNVERPFELPKDFNVKPKSSFTERDWVKRREENKGLTLNPSKDKDFRLYKKAIVAVNLALKN